MKEIAIISGKGGTGKTFFSSNFAVFLKNKVIVDCDVDAANLHLLLPHKVEKKEKFFAGKKVFIDLEKCTGCGVCREVCPFDGVKEFEGQFQIDEINCEGCLLCYHLCESRAIRLEDKLCGEFYISSTKYGPFVHAHLFPGEENSGKLVIKLKEVAREIAEKEGLDYLLIDGPPGVGCPVIATLTGSTHVVILTEPTPSGVHDLKRTLELVSRFDAKVSVVINKFDLNMKISEKIEKEFKDKGILKVFKLPFNEMVQETVRDCKLYVEVIKDEFSGKLRSIYEQILD